MVLRRLLNLILEKIQKCNILQLFYNPNSSRSAKKITFSTKKLS